MHCGYYRISSLDFIWFMGTKPNKYFENRMPNEKLFRANRFNYDLPISVFI